MPSELIVKGEEIFFDNNIGRVNVNILDSKTKEKYVEGFYEYTFHEKIEETQSHDFQTEIKSKKNLYLVTGASGGLGKTLLRLLGSEAKGMSRSEKDGFIKFDYEDDIDSVTCIEEVSGIIHCAWPNLDKTPLINLEDVGSSVEAYFQNPLTMLIKLSQLLKNKGKPGAPLILIGSTSANPGRHSFKSPLYSLSKSLIPSLTKILSLELGAQGYRCISLIYDFLDGGMNKTVGKLLKEGHAQRSPFGRVGTMEDAAQQISWVINNKNHLINGAIIDVTGGVVP